MPPSTLLTALALALALALVPPLAAATIVSDNGFRCIFNARRVLASNAQRGLSGASVPALSGNYDDSNLGCALHTPTPSGAGGTFPFSVPWCIVDQLLCPTASQGIMCGTLYSTIGYVDTCNTARITGFAVQPNTAILDPAQQTDGYTFFAGQSVTISIDRNQTRVLADELLRISVTNPTGPVTTQITSNRVGYNISGVGATPATTTSGLPNGVALVASASSSADTASFLITSAWGLGSGITLSVAVGISCSGTPCSGSTPAVPCTGGGGGGCGQLGTSRSGGIPATIASASIRVLPSTVTGVNVFDPVLNQLVSVPAAGTVGAAAGLGGIAASGQNVSIIYTASGGTAGVARQAVLYFEYTNGGGCGGAGGTVTLPASVSSLTFVRYSTWNFAEPSLPGNNTVANGGAMSFAVPASIVTASVQCGGGSNTVPGPGVRWVVAVTLAGVTGYSRLFSIFVPSPSPTPTRTGTTSPSTTPSTGASQTGTPSQTPTPSLSRGSSASSSVTPTSSASPTISDTSRPSTSAQPDLLAIAKAQQEALATPIAGAAGGIVAVVLVGVVVYLVRQRRARQEARMRMKASSRRHMESSHDNAYGNTRKDGHVNIGARTSRQNETTVMFQVQLPQGASLPASSRPSGGRRPARSSFAPAGARSSLTSKN